jgi:hypothetical protein
VTVDLEWLYLPATFLLVGASVTAIVVAALVLIGSRRGRRIRVFGRVMHSPRLSAVTLACGGVTGLLSATHDVMPSNWQRPSLIVWLLVGVAFFILSVAQLVVDERAKRASNDKPEVGE